MDEAVPLYPRVKGEFETVRALLKGRSIARYGDGELKILEGSGYSREVANGYLTAEMRSIVAGPAAGCLVAIPTMDPAGPKAQNWERHRLRFCRYFRHGDGRNYYSAFITRPDSAADDLECVEYCQLVAKLWSRKKRIVVLSETDSKLLTAVQMTAKDVIHHECPTYGAYHRINELERNILRYRPDIVLLSCGPTATCLANRFAGRGIQGLDLGSIGGLLLRWLK